MTKDKWHGHIAIFSANILFGLNIPIAKTLMPEWIDPIGLTFLRMSFGALAFWITSLFVLNEKVSKKDLLILFFCAILGTTMNQFTFIKGLGMTSPIDAGLIVTMKKAGGVLIGACGAVLIIWHSYAVGISGGSGSSMTGNLLCFISVICYATYLVISKPIAQRYSPVTLMKWMFLFSTILMFPFSIQEVVEAKLFSPDTTFSALASVFYVVFAATFLAYLFIPIALKRIRPTTISMYNYAQPLVAATLAILMGQDRLTWDKPVAAVLVFTGVYLVTQSKSRADMERSSGK